MLLHLIYAADPDGICVFYKGSVYLTLPFQKCCAFSYWSLYSCIWSQVNNNRSSSGLMCSGCSGSMMFWFSLASSSSRKFLWHEIYCVTLNATRILVYAWRKCLMPVCIYLCTYLSSGIATAIKLPPGVKVSYQRASARGTARIWCNLIG